MTEEEGHLGKWTLTRAGGAASPDKGRGNFEKESDPGSLRFGRDDTKNERALRDSLKVRPSG
jgi:hypothetical protein